MKQKENRLIVADIGWAEDIPEWILEAIKSERLNCPEEVGNAELVAYLITASLKAPMTSAHANIYLFLTKELMVKCNKLNKDDIPDFMNVELSEDEKRDLEELRRDIFKVRGRII